MAFSNNTRDETKNRVREAADIVEVIGESVPLRRAGTGFIGLCPFHDEKTPSFSVNSRGQFFHCFGCGESGDIFAFMMKYHHISFPDALKELARRYQIDLPEPKLSGAERKQRQQREQLYQVNHDAAVIFHEFLLSAKARTARRYLHERGVPLETVEKYRLGYAPPPESGGWTFISRRLQERGVSLAIVEQAGLAIKKDNGGHYDRFRNRILFPIYDLSGREVAFGGRILGEGRPKYINSPESLIFEKSRILFGLYQHRQAIRKSRRAVVVEGNFDLLLLAVHRIENVVALLGTSLTRQHIRSLRRYCDEAVLLFDGDSAGLRAAIRSIPFFLNEQMDGRVALLPEGHDPDSLVRKKGAEGIQKLLDAAEPLPEFVFSALVREHGLTLSGKNRIMAELTDLVREATDLSRRELMAAHFAEKLGVVPTLFLSRDHGEKPKEQKKIRNQKTAQSEPAKTSIDSFSRLPAQHQRLLKFLGLYPDFFRGQLKDELLKHNSRFCAPPVQTVALMQRLTATGEFTSEQFLSEFERLPIQEKQYIKNLIGNGGRDIFDDGEQDSKFYNELLKRLKLSNKQHEEAELQEQINQAQQTGDIDNELIEELYKRRLLAPYSD